MSEKEAIKPPDGKVAEVSQQHSQDKASHDGRSDHHAGIMNLQRSAGNRAVANLLQDNMSPTNSNNDTKSPALSGLGGQTTVSAPDDSYEREADRVADTALQDAVLRGASPACAESIANNAAQDGQHLSPAARRFWESRFGYDFSNVKVHTGKTAADAANNLDADAYTVGSNIVLGSEQEMQDTRLMAHELTHVIQQGAAHSTGSGVSVPVSQMPSNSGGAQVQRQTKGQAKKTKGPVKKTQGQAKSPPKNAPIVSYNVNNILIKQLVHEKHNTDISKLIESNRLDGRPSEVKQPNATGSATKWRLKIDLNYTSLSTAGTTTEENDKSHLPANTRQINIMINPIRVEPNPDYERAIPDTSRRGHTLLAQTLYHELVHALILMEEAQPPGAKHSATYKKYKKLLGIADSASFTLYKSAVTGKLRELVAAARGGNKLDGEDGIVEETLRYLINEKFSNQSAETAFRPKAAGKPSEDFNHKIARRYAKEGASKILSWTLYKGAHPPIGNSLWKDPWDKKVESLIEPLFSLFKEMDSEVAHPMEELMPQPAFGAETLKANPEPAELEGLKRKKK